MSMKEVIDALQKNSEKMDAIKRFIGEEELLIQLAEETAELGQAALKLRRSLDGCNVTPVLPIEAEEHLQEEIADVLLLVYMCGMDSGEVARVIYKKVPRWCGRLGLNK